MRQAFVNVSGVRLFECSVSKAEEIYNTGISILARFIFGEFPKITSSKSLKVKEGIGSFDCF